MPTSIDSFWSLLLAGDSASVASMLDGDPSWDDPVFDGARGADVAKVAIPRFAEWLAARSARKVQPYCRTAGGTRVIVEDVLRLKNGVIWNQAASREEKAPEYDLAVAVVAERSKTTPERIASFRVYFSTWAALEGKSRLRVGPICPDERADAARAMAAMPTVKTYFERLAVGDPKIAELFEPDGYFREPANNFACGATQLAEHFSRILDLGGVGIEFLTATREGDRIGLELQTVKWGTKSMAEPQAGLALYELGPYGLLRASRVYDSVVPPAFD